MADSKITALTDGGDLQAGDQFVIARSGANNKIADTKVGMAVIFDSLLSGTQATFDTNTILGGNIPATYRQLMAVLYARCTDAVTNEAINMQLNGDTAGNYDYAQLSVNAAGTVSGSGNTGGTSAIVAQPPGSSATANRFGSSTIVFPNYAATTGDKIWTAQAMLVRGTATTDMFVVNYSGNWRSTAAINRILLTPASGSFATGSRFTLYGLR